MQNDYSNTASQTTRNHDQLRLPMQTRVLLFGFIPQETSCSIPIDLPPLTQRTSLPNGLPKELHQEDLDAPPQQSNGKHTRSWMHRQLGRLRTPTSTRSLTSLTLTAARSTRATSATTVTSVTFSCSHDCRLNFLFLCNGLTLFFFSAVGFCLRRAPSSGAEVAPASGPLAGGAGGAASVTAEAVSLSAASGGGVAVCFFCRDGKKYQFQKLEPKVQ
jgi:hypothetical protein